ncbi:MAG: GNAT family N-acetyltransferase [Acidobacteria bacterium]|nr:GNAT family N-acetyltransferase [Acidobacteriota bacterium]
MIRNFAPQDAEGCSRVVRACIGADPSLPPALRNRMIRAESAGSMLERARLFYVAVCENDSRISGLAGLDMNEIRILCVSPEKQRCGIGRALLGHVTGIVPGALFRDIFVYAANGAVDFYKAAGFGEKGPVIFDFEGEKLETVFMTRMIR